MKGMVHKLDGEMRKRLLVRRMTGLKRGMWGGWRELYDHYSSKIGSTTYFVAPPAVGKTALINELATNLAEFEDCKVCMFTPETGSPEDVYNELLWSFLKQPFINHPDSTLTKGDINMALDWMAEHFYILDPLNADLNERLYFDAILRLQDEEKVKINLAVIDPITDMQITENSARDLALGNFLTRVRKFSSTEDLHSFVAFHTKAMNLVEGKDLNNNKCRYYPPPTMGDVAGGEMASRKGMFILGLWRPPANVIDPETEMPYIANESRVEILKAKPKAIGKQGVVKLYYHKYSTRYYMKGADNKKVWSQPKPNDLET